MPRITSTAARPAAPLLALTGNNASKAFDQVVAGQGADTDSFAYQAGKIVGIPIPGAGAGRAGAKAAEIGASQLVARATKSADTRLSAGGGRARLAMTMETVRVTASKFGIPIDDLTIRINKARAGMPGSSIASPTSPRRSAPPPRSRPATRSSVWPTR
jgi:hypothetical protein